MRFAAADVRCVVSRADIPRKCSATNRLIPAGDHASVQFNSAPARFGPARFALLAGRLRGRALTGRLCAVGHVSEDGLYTKEYTTVAFSGFIRKKVRSQTSLSTDQRPAHRPTVDAPLTFEPRCPGRLRRCAGGYRAGKGFDLMHVH